jgi:hypothetical protein
MSSAPLPRRTPFSGDAQPLAGSEQCFSAPSDTCFAFCDYYLSHSDAGAAFSDKMQIHSQDTALNHWIPLICTAELVGSVHGICVD